MHREQRLKHLLQAIPGLSDFRLSLIDDIISVLERPCEFACAANSDLVSQSVLSDFGDILRMHNSFSRQPFSKDKFEYALEKILVASGVSASLAPRGQRGFDISIEGEQFSLKTEAGSAIKLNTLHISKFMELGGGDWGDNPSDLEGLRQQFLDNLSTIERILTLRALKKNNPFVYELVEIPKELLEKAASGSLEMKLDSTQYPKPGYCYVRDDELLQYSLYFDGGGERKLQIKSLRKELCIVHATWKFDLPTSTP